MTQKILGPDLVAGIREITNRFITSRDGTPVHTAKSKLGKKKKHDLLEGAVRDRYLLDIGPKYFPTFRALELEDPASRFSVERCVTLAFQALKEHLRAKWGQDLFARRNT